MKKETKAKIKKLIPWVIGGGVVIAGGIMLYNYGHGKGYFKGVEDGMHEGVQRTLHSIADHISGRNNFCIYKNSNGVPTFFTGLSIYGAEDVKDAIDMMEVIYPSASKNIYEESIRNLATTVLGENAANDVAEMFKIVAEK